MVSYLLLGEDWLHKLRRSLLDGWLILIEDILFTKSG